MAERKKLAIIDGKSVFYRGYYAMPNLSTKDGVPTGGVYGFMAMSLELIKRYKPDYVCVAWDKPKTNIRKRLAIYPEYKAGRKPAPDDFYVQIPILHEVLEAFSWPLYEFDDYEADDIMHTLAKKADEAGLETMLITSDMDALQSISEHTHMYALKKGLTNIQKFDPSEFEKKYGISVEQFLDSKALKGDSSDNIPGVPGIGEKSASALLNEFKTLDGIYENLALVKAAWAKKLEAGKDSAYLSREVARMFDDAPVELDLQAMDINDLDTEKLREILMKLEFRTLLKSLPDGMQSKNGGKINVDSSGALIELHTPEIKMVLNDTEVELSNGVVLHTRAAGKHGEKPLYVVLADESTCYVFAGSQFERVKGVLQGVTTVAGYDLKHDFQVLLELGIENFPTIEHDTHVGAFIIDSLRRDLSLSELAGDLGYDVAVEDLDDEEFLAKVGDIVAVIRELTDYQSEKMSEVTSLIKMAEVVDWPVIPVLARLERAGMKLDLAFFEKLSDDLAERILTVEQTIYGHADQEFNISSPSQLSEILFDKLQLPTNVTKKGKAGHYSTAVGVLQKLKGSHPIIEEIEKYREYTKLKSTYVDPLPGMVDTNDRLHSTMNMTVAATGRLSSNDPNLQNIPVRTELGREIRKGFIADKGNVIISADYSQFELRIAAAMSGDEAMIKAFNEDSDIHTETAALIQGVKPEDVTKEMRYAAKAVNFGILYGQGVHGLSEGTGLSYAEAKEFIDKYFEVRPKLRGMIDGFKDMAKNKGYVETVMGRRRPTPDVQSSNFMVREGAYRAAINMPIQGSAADLTKMAMSAIEPKLPKGAFQIMQIHDSIMVECKEKDAKKIGKMMKETMESIKPDLGVKLKVDVSIGKNWGEL